MAKSRQGDEQDKPETKHPAKSPQIYISNIRSAENKHLCYFKGLPHLSSSSVNYTDD